MKKLLEEEKQNNEKREAALNQQKREMQMEIQRLNDRESKRRKILAANSNANHNPLNQPNNTIHNPNNNTANLDWLKSKISNCFIF